MANAAITDMMRQRDVAALDAKYTKELVDAEAENDALRDDVAAGRRRSRGNIKGPPASAKPPRSGVIRSLPRLADTAERDYFTLRERLITMQKQLKEPRSILMTVQIELPISMGNSCNYCSNT